MSLVTSEPFSLPANVTVLSAFSPSDDDFVEFAFSATPTVTINPPTGFQGSVDGVTWQNPVSGSVGGGTLNLTFVSGDIQFYRIQVGYTGVTFPAGTLVVPVSGAVGQG